MKKILALLLTLVTLSACLVGCGKSKETSTDDDVLVVYGPNKALDDVTDNLTWMQEELGFKIRYITVSGEEYNSKLNLLITSGETPDIMVLDETTYYDYLDQGLLLEIEDLLKEHAPNVFKHRTEEQINALRYYKDGKLYAVANNINPGYNCHLIREDWLENLGLDVPETLDEYIEVMRAFTFDDPDGNGKDDTYGFGGSGGFENVFANFFPCYGANASQWILKDDKIGLGTVQDEVKEALKTLRQLYKEGVVDPEYLTADSTLTNKKIMDGKWGIFASQLWYADDDNSMYPGVPLTVAPAPKIDGKGGYISPMNPYADMYTAISAECKHPDRAAKLLNFIADLDNYIRIRSGIEGVHYYIKEDGTKEATDAVKADPTLTVKFGIAPTYAMPFMPVDVPDASPESQAYLELVRREQEGYWAATYSTAPEIKDGMLGVGYRDCFKKWCNKMIMEETDIDETFEAMKKELYDDYDLAEIEKLQTEHYYSTNGTLVNK